MQKIVATHTKVEVSELPKCQFPHYLAIIRDEARYDCKIPALGSWANICQHHFDFWNCKLGLGEGQELILTRERQGE